MNSYISAINKQSNHHDMTIVVNTCDAYHDVLDIFFHAFIDYWPNCPYPVVINTESRTYNYPARVHHHISPEGSDDWGARLRATLASIDTEFVMMLYDDFILEAPVSNQRVQQAIELLQAQTSGVVTYLVDTASPLIRTDTDEQFIALKDRVEYRLNSAPGIWRKQALMNYTEEGDTPWTWEVFGTYRTWGDGKDFYTLNPAQSDVYLYNHNKGGAIYRGKWVREVVEKAAQKYPLQIDWAERGFSSDIFFEKRSLTWKLRFMQTGFRMVGWKAIYFVMSYLRKKLNVRSI
jgi:hypothetical protein